MLKTAIKGGVSVCLRLSTFARVFASAFACVCQHLSAFVCVCSHLLTPPFVAPPLRDTDIYIYVYLFIFFFGGGGGGGNFCRCFTKGF